MDEQNEEDMREGMSEKREPGTTGIYRKTKDGYKNGLYNETKIGCGWEDKYEQEVSEKTIEQERKQEEEKSRWNGKCRKN